MKEEAIVDCTEELDRLSVMFNTSLDVSEANADALRLRKEDLELDQTLRSMIELYEPSFSQAGLTLALKATGPVFIYADPALIQRTITNLFENELKHVSSGTKVTVTLVQGPEHVSFLLEDDGPGFPRDFLPRVFERYAKGPSSGGHGLGLAFVAAVVKSHNGTVRAENVSGGGARIELEFPRIPS